MYGWQGGEIGGSSPPEPKLSRRQRLGGLLDALGIVDGVKRARMAFGVSPFPVLTYHRIAVHDSADPFDPEVIDATPQVFEEHVRMLARNFTLVGTREIRAHFLGTRPLPADAAMITFDDGYRSCRDVAVPILRRYGACAVFFISTGHITSRRLFWWDRTSYIVRRSRAPEIRLEYPEPLHITRTPGDTRTVTTRLLRIIKDTYGLDVERFLTELAQSAGVPWSDDVDAQLADDLLLTWDDVRAIRDAGMDIESHTRWHRVLDTLAPSDLDEELRGSRSDLEAQLGDPVRVISYPVGRGSDPRVAAAVARAGYDVGFSNATGINDLRGAMMPLSVRRAAVDSWVPNAVLRASMLVPNLSEVSAPRKPR